MGAQGSITQCLPLLRFGDGEAARQVWQHYFERLVGLARERIRGLPGWQADGEDVALSAFKSFYRAVEGGGFQQLADRNDLWSVLALLIRRKACDHARHVGRLCRGGEQAHVPPDEQLADPGPSPDREAEAADECRFLLGCLGEPALQRLALLKLEGHTDREVADRLGCGLRTVERKLERIRRIWQEKLGR